MSSENNQSSSANGFNVSSDLLERLADTMTSAQLTEIEFVDGERSLRLTRSPAPIAQAVQAFAPAAAAPMAAPAPAAMPAAAAPTPAAAAPAAEDGNAVKSPMVGTAYLSSEPGKPTFVSVGDKVSKGQTLMIIEAMKVMNPLPSPADGVVKAVLVGDGEPVEFDQAVVVLG